MLSDPLSSPLDEPMRAPDAGRSRSAPELIVNGTFDADLTGWTVSQPGASTAVWSAGTAAITGDGSNGAYISQSFPTIPGRRYVATFTIAAAVASVRVGNVVNGTSVYNANLSAGAGQQVPFVATHATMWISFNRSAVGTSNVDNVSVR